MSFIATKKHAPASLGSLLVLGLGKSGKAVVEYGRELLGQRVSAITIVASNTEDSRGYFRALNDPRIDIIFDVEEVEGSYDLGIVSPGISEFSSLYQSALRACGEVIGEVEFAWRESTEDARWVAVTGTNGKTTTTSLIAHLLQKDGMRAQAVGNIGDTCIEAVKGDQVDIYVAETSSYQLASTVYFAPDVAVLLNITPDHLDWHTDFEHYVDAKRKLFSNLRPSDGAVSVLNATDDLTRDIVKEMKNGGNSLSGLSYIPIGTAAGLENSMREACGSTNAAFVREGNLVLCYEGREYQFINAAELSIMGSHNLVNALSAVSSAVILGAGSQAINEGLRSFQPLEHRIEPCGLVEGVAYFNDSKATNTDATIQALSAFDLDHLVLLLGGYDKGTDLADLAESTQGCKAIICFGAARDRFAAALKNEQVFSKASLAEALEKARNLALAGDSILLSPACASFDEFDSFEHRGAVFKQIVSSYQTERV